MRLRRCVAIVAFVAGSGLSAIQGEALAQEAAPSARKPTSVQVLEARDHFQRALLLTEEGDTRNALIEFQTAYKLAPNYRLKYNIGVACYQMQDYLCAMRHLQDYSEQLSMDVEATPERRNEVAKLLDRLRGRVGSVELSVNAPDAVVTVDEEEIGRAPLVNVPMSSGRRKISVSASGYLTETRFVDLAGGETTKLAITLKAAPKSQIIVRSEASGGRMTTLTWLGLGAAGVLGAAGIATGVAAKGAESTARAAVYSGQDPSTEAQSDLSRGKGLAVASNVLLVGAGVTAVTTVVLTLLRKKEDPAPVLLGVQVGPGSVGYRGEF